MMNAMRRWPIATSCSVILAQLSRSFVNTLRLTSDLSAGAILPNGIASCSKKSMTAARSDERRRNDHPRRARLMNAPPDLVPSFGDW